MLHCVALVRTDVSEEFSASIIRVTRIGELGTMLSVTSNRRFVFLHSTCRLLVTAIFLCTQFIVTLLMEPLSFSKTSFLTRAIWRNIPEDAILHSHHSEGLKSYKIYSIHIHSLGQKIGCVGVCLSIYI
jgi:hypothetical protein